MIGAMSLFDNVNFLQPNAGAAPDPADNAAMVAFTNAFRALTPEGQRAAFAFVAAPADETATSGAARKDYLRYLGIAGALGLAIGAAAMFAIKR